MIFQRLLFFFCAVVILSGLPAAADDWREIGDKHFIVHYDKRVSTEAARQALRRAEEGYTQIASKLGYARYADFWTWEQRVKIIIYANQAEFMQHTGQPPWSLGYADRDARLLKSRAIVTYYQEHDFFDGVLPHEIGHLILRDFVGPGVRIPLWFDEGVAQAQEPQKVAFAQQLMPRLAAQNRHIPLAEFIKLDIRAERDKQRVKIFYAQSVSVVDFLIRHYGRDAFSRLCRSLAEGHEFERALAVSYPTGANSISLLEKKWIDSLR